MSIAQAVKIKELEDKTNQLALAVVQLQQRIAQLEQKPRGRSSSDLKVAG